MPKARKGGGKPWSAEEEDLLRERYAYEGARALADVLGRTSTAVKVRAQKLGLRYRWRRWTPAEEEMLRRQWSGPGEWDDRLLEVLPRHSRSSIQRRASELGLTRKPTYTHRPWTPAEEDLLVERYPIEGALRLERRMARTAKAIKARAAKLGMRYVGPRGRFHQ